MDLTATHPAPVQDSPGVNLMPPTVFYACLMAGGALEFVFPQAFPWIPVPLRIVLGILLAAAGFTFMGIAHEAFKRRETNVPTNEPATVLIVRGAYRYSRNPMYVGGAAFFAGIGLATGSLWIMAAVVPLIIFLAAYVVPREEAYMAREFGEAYRDYCRRVRRWL